MRKGSLILGLLSLMVSYVIFQYFAQDIVVKAQGAELELVPVGVFDEGIALSRVGPVQLTPHSSTWYYSETEDYMFFRDSTTTPGFQVQIYMSSTDNGDFIYSGTSVGDYDFDESNLKIWANFASETGGPLAPTVGVDTNTVWEVISSESCASATDMGFYGFDSVFSSSSSDYGLEMSATAQDYFTSSVSCEVEGRLDIRRMRLLIPGESPMGTYTSTMVIMVIDGYGAGGMGAPLQGTAATGRPIDGIVELTDINGEKKFAQTDPDTGDFEFNVSELQSPFMLRVTDPIEDKTYYSCSTRPNRITNITPLTDYAMRMAAKVIKNKKNKDKVKRLKEIKLNGDLEEDELEEDLENGIGNIDFESVVIEGNDDDDDDDDDDDFESTETFEATETFESTQTFESTETFEATETFEETNTAEPQPEPEEDPDPEAAPAVEASLLRASLLAAIAPITPEATREVINAEVETEPEPEGESVEVPKKYSTKKISNELEALFENHNFGDHCLYAEQKGDLIVKENYEEAFIEREVSIDEFNVLRTAFEADGEDFDGVLDDLEDRGYIEENGSKIYFFDDDEDKDGYHDLDKDKDGFRDDDKDEDGLVEFDDDEEDEGEDFDDEDEVVEEEDDGILKDEHQMDIVMKIVGEQILGELEKPICPLFPQENRLIINFSGEEIRADVNQDRASDGPMEVEIEPGVYSVTLASYDNHSEQEEEIEQFGEAWYLKLLDIEGNPMMFTKPIDDLVEDQDFAIQEIETEFEINKTIYGVTAYHDSYQSDFPEEVVPLCAAFDLNVDGEDQKDEKDKKEKKDKDEDDLKKEKEKDDKKQRDPEEIIEDLEEASFIESITFEDEENVTLSISATAPEECEVEEEPIEDVEEEEFVEVVEEEKVEPELDDVIEEIEVNEEVEESMEDDENGQESIDNFTSENEIIEEEEEVEANTVEEIENSASVIFEKISNFMFLEVLTLLII